MNHLHRGAPLVTMIQPLETMMDNCNYSFRDTAAVPNVKELCVMYRLKSQIDGFHPTMGTFDEFRPIHLLPFLAKIKDPLDALGKSKEISMRIFAYVLKDDVKDAYDTEVNPGTAASPFAASWPYVIH